MRSNKALISIAIFLSLGCLMPTEASFEGDPQYEFEADFPLELMKLIPSQTNDGLEIELHVRNDADFDVEAFRSTLWFYDKFGDPVAASPIGFHFTSYQYQETIPSGEGAAVGNTNGIVQGAHEMVFMFEKYLNDGEEFMCDDLPDSWSALEGPHDPCSVTVAVE